MCNVFSTNLDPGSVWLSAQEANGSGLPWYLNLDSTECPTHLPVKSVSARAGILRRRTRELHCHGIVSSHDDLLGSPGWVRENCDNPLCTSSTPAVPHTLETASNVERSCVESADLFHFRLRTCHLRLCIKTCANSELRKFSPDWDVQAYCLSRCRAMFAVASATAAR